MSTKILIGADIVPTASNFNLFTLSDIRTLLGEDLMDILDRADFKVLNLEVPLTDIETPIKKSGPNLISPTSVIKGLREINKYFYGLANNHIYDQDSQGLFSTINLLEQENINYAGAGKNVEEARKPFIIMLNGIKIGIYCCAEHEFSIAKDDKPGANPFDPLESFDHVLELKLQCDFIIILYHGGKEYYRYPSPQLQKICRKFIDKGANLVVCQHTHCVGCKEHWNGGIIVYGQGNFLFDGGKNDFWQTSLLISVELDKECDGTLRVNINYIPLVKLDEKVRLAINNTSILTEFENRSKIIEDSKQLQLLYKKFSDEMISEYLNAFGGKNTKRLLYRAINKLSNYRFDKWFMNKRYSEKEKLKLINYIECEAHREILLEGLKDLDNYGI